MNNEVKTVKKQNICKKNKRDVKSNKNKTITKKVCKIKHLQYKKIK